MKQGIYNPDAHLDYFSASLNELKMLLYAVFLYLKIDVDLMVILGWLMIIDTCVGPVKVLRIDPREFSFKQTVIGFLTKLAILMLPLTLALVMKGLGLQFNLLTVFAIKLLIVSEGISIVSNMISIKTKKEVKDFDLITRFLKWVRQYFTTLAEVLFTGLKNHNKDDGAN